MSLMKPKDSVSYTSNLTFIFGPDWTEQDVKFQASDDRVWGGSSKVPHCFCYSLNLSLILKSIPTGI
jgi:hypothetical protein